MTDERQHPLYYRTLMFLTLFVECEKWALVMKGSVDKDFKWRLENFLSSARILMTYCKRLVDEEALEDFGERFSRVIERIGEADPDKREELFELLDKWAKGEVQIIGTVEP